GVLLFSHVAGEYPGGWEPLLDELDRRAAFVMIHPTAPPYEPPTAHPVWAYEFPFETTRAVASLISAGAPARWPRIRWQLAHLGATVPFLAEGLAGLGGAGAHDWLRRVYFDTALSTDPAALAATRALAGRRQIVFGSDFPYATGDSASLFEHGA